MTQQQKAFLKKLTLLVAMMACTFSVLWVESGRPGHSAQMAAIIGPVKSLVVGIHALVWRWVLG